jgi:hypothetical protein
MIATRAPVVRADENLTAFQNSIGDSRLRRIVSQIYEFSRHS